MANKNMGRILSGAVIVFCVILLCTLSISGQQFKVRKLTFTISGSVGLSGVKMTGLPNSPVTDESGYYSDTVEFNWSGKVTPVKAGYTFDPPYRPYNNVKSNLENQDYTAQIMKFTISGSVGEAGVVMAGLPDSPVSGSDGTYKAVVEYGWSGTVTPEKAGYTFTPPSKEYTQVNRHYANENYTAALITFDITGSVGEEGVLMKGLPKPIFSDASGNYRGEVPYGWSGTITPEKAGYTFSPPSRPYSNVVNAQTYQDYIAEAITFVISGTTGEAGVVMKGLPDNPITNSVGSYTAVVNYGFSGKVTPEKDGFTFKPPSMTYVDVKNDMGNQNYTAEEITYTISGLVGQEGVVMNGLPGNPVSGKGGTYKVTVPHGWSGAVTPTKDGFTFTPDSKIYPRVTANLSNENYTAIPITFTISGTAGVGRVVMKGLPGRVITNENGYYEATVIYGWSGTVTPERAGYDFDPPNRTYPRLISAEVNQDYVPTLQKRTISGKILSAQGPIAGVIVSANNEGGSTTTNANGEYSLLVDYGWSGTVAPKSEGYTFRPNNKRYPLVTTDQTNQDYTAEVIMLTISGTLAIDGVPLEGVLMSASQGGISDTTDAKGYYSVKVPYGWSGEISPKKEGYTFDPPSETYTNVTTDYKDGKAVPREPPTPKPAVPEPEPLTPRPA
ncbi:MAG: carboxypeptidase-like regulatory domain-containing protein, partial [Sedimentisphaerales bacterium]